MVVNTKYFGELEIDEMDIIQFPKGIIGFEDFNRYIIIPFDETEAKGPHCLQSIEEEALAFVVLNPFLFEIGYNPQFLPEDLAELEIGEQTEVTILAITVVNEKFSESTINLKCPVVINNATRKAKQTVIENDVPLRRKISEGNGGEA